MRPWTDDQGRVAIALLQEKAKEKGAPEPAPTDAPAPTEEPGGAAMAGDDAPTAPSTEPTAEAATEPAAPAAEAPFSPKIAHAGLDSKLYKKYEKEIDEHYNHMAKTPPEYKEEM